MMDDMPSDPSDNESPEVTISPADNGHVVRWHQRSSKKGEPGRTIKRVASTKEEALGHADEALGGGSSGAGDVKSSKKRSIQRGDGAPTEGAIGEHALHSSASHSSRDRTRRRRPRTGGRR